jgi:hypothetical protein
VFRRLFWLIVGAGFGFGLSFWLTRAVRQTVERYSPDRVSDDLAAAIRTFGQDIRTAVREGRAAMAEREAEIRSELDNHARRRR